MSTETDMSIELSMIFFFSLGKFPVIAETTSSEFTSTCKLVEQFSDIEQACRSDKDSKIKLLRSFHDFLNMPIFSSAPNVSSSSLKSSFSAVFFLFKKVAMFRHCNHSIVRQF